MADHKTARGHSSTHSNTGGALPDCNRTKTRTFSAPLLSSCASVSASAVASERRRCVRQLRQSYYKYARVYVHYSCMCVARVCSRVVLRVLVLRVFCFACVLCVFVIAFSRAARISCVSSLRVTFLVVMFATTVFAYCQIVCASVDALCTLRGYWYGVVRRRIGSG